MLKVIRYFTLIVGLCLLARTDLQERRIPNKLLKWLFVGQSVLLVAECVCVSREWSKLVGQFVDGMVLGGGIFLGCYLLHKDAVGAGDVKLMAVVGYYIGRNRILETIFFSLLIAVFYGGLHGSQNDSMKRKTLPFAPFALIGAIFTILFEL